MTELNQAKKRESKIYITDIAISKVPFIPVDIHTEEFAKNIQHMHKCLLEISKKDNNSDEVLTVYDMVKNQAEYVMGDSFHVKLAVNPSAYGLLAYASKNAIWYLHNHPSTNKFSLSDIRTFIKNTQIEGMSVVTNQGDVHILYKTDKYDYPKVRDLFTVSVKDFADRKVSHNEAVEMFLKKCRKGGIEYARS